MLRAFKGLAIALSPALLFLVLIAKEDSLGRQMFNAALQSEHARPEAPLKAAVEGAVSEALATPFIPAVRPEPRPAHIELAKIRPKMRPDPLAPIVARIKRAITTTSAASIGKPPRSKVGLSAEDCLAVANYHEARGEGIRGQVAVSSVVLQRAAVPGRWGKTPCEVVRPVMFEFMSGPTSFPPILDLKAWKVAKIIARDALRTGPLPQLRGADHYHAHRVSPYWRKAMPRVAVIGDHIFYADPLSRL